MDCLIKNNETIKLGKKGVNYVTTVVDECNCNFNPIFQENVIGIDGQIELFSKERIPTGNLIAVQIKTGKSYYDLKKCECNLPIDSHREYWKTLKMPVIGIICIMDETNESIKTAYWVDIKKYLIKNTNAKSIKFKMSMYNEFSKTKFTDYFSYIVCDKLPKVSFQKAKILLNGDTLDRKLALDILQVYYSNEVQTWEKIFYLYEKKDVSIKYSIFFEAVSYAYAHPDHWLKSGIHEFSDESEKYVQEKVKSFNEQDIVNILSIIEGHFYDRGTLGQTADILISNIQDSANKMFNIILNHKIDIDIRYDAEILLAHQSKEFYIRNKELIKNMKSEYTELIVQYIEKFGEFDLY